VRGREVEDSPVLHAVIRDPFHRAFVIEIYRQDALVDQLRLQEGGGAPAGLRDVVEHLVVEHFFRGRRSQRQQHLFAAGARRDELQRLLIDNEALLVGLARRQHFRGRATAQHDRAACEQNGEGRRQSHSFLDFSRRHHHLRQS
jgi:hypothetical protein